MKETKLRCVFEDAKGELSLIDLTIEQIRQGYPLVGIGEKIIDWLLYTNLKDKNGKEIYDGDIVRICDEIKRKLVQDNYQVRWNNDSAKWDVALKHGWRSLHCALDIKVIGNIHETPELLE